MYNNEELLEFVDTVIIMQGTNGIRGNHATQKDGNKVDRNLMRAARKVTSKTKVAVKIFQWTYRRD